MEENKVAGELTPQEIAQLKARNGGVLFFAKADGHVAYFRKPNIQEVAVALSMKEKPVEMIEFMFENCKVAGSDIFLKEVDFMLGAGKVVGEMLAVKQVEVGNL
jgi:hypothetical protein